MLATMQHSVPFQHSMEIISKTWSCPETYSFLVAQYEHSSLAYLTAGINTARHLTIMCRDWATCIIVQQVYHSMRYTAIKLVV